MDELRAGDGNGTTVRGSLERLFHSSQKLLEHRMELARLEARLKVVDSARSLSVAACAVAALALGWLCLLIALVMAVPPPVRPPAVAIIGAAHLIAGAAVLAWALHGVRDGNGG